MSCWYNSVLRKENAGYTRIMVSNELPENISKTCFNTKWIYRRGYEIALLAKIPSWWFTKSFLGGLYVFHDEEADRQWDLWKASVGSLKKRLSLSECATSFLFVATDANAFNRQDQSSMSLIWWRICIQSTQYSENCCAMFFPFKNFIWNR